MNSLHDIDVDETFTAECGCVLKKIGRKGFSKKWLPKGSLVKLVKIGTKCKKRRKNCWSLMRDADVGSMFWISSEHPVRERHGKNKVHRRS